MSPGRALLTAVCLFLAGAVAALPRTQAQATPAAPSAAQQAPAQPAPAEKTPVQGYTLSPDKAQQAIAYARARHELYFVDFVYGLVVLLLVLQLGIAPKLRDWAERAGRNRFLQALVFAPLLLLTIGIVTLPTDIWGHWLELKFQQSIQRWGWWFWDWTKGELLGLLLGIFLVWILYAVIRRSPRRWWFYFWLVSLPILLFLLFIFPLVIEPMFFTFTPLARTQPQLAAEIERVVHRAGLEIPESRMFEMNASSKLKSVNAYATGVGASKRVVVWDTTIARMTTPEILFVFGHEMGHYVLGHIRKGFLFTAAVLFVFFYLGYRGLLWMLRRWGGGWGIRGPDDLASLPALLFLLAIFSFLFTPVSNAFSRYLEHQADVYGLEVIHGIVPNEPEVAAQAFQILGEVDLEEPNPSTSVKIWFYTHPPLDERIRLARTYDPWATGRPPQFVK